MTRHVLKSWPSFFNAIAAGDKAFDLRLDDRSYRVGDEVELHEYDHAKKEFTGRSLVRRVSYITRPGGAEACAYSPAALQSGFLILGYGYCDA